MAKATDGAKGMAARLAHRAGLKHESSDQSTSLSHDAKLTRSKSDDNELAATENTHSPFEFSANYWPEGIALPESGKLHLDESSLLFEGTTTELTFYYEDIAIDKTSKMGAFKITVANHNEGGHTEYLFTTILKDRKLVFDTICDAIEKAKMQPVIKKKREKPFEMPLDEIISKMNFIGKERLKGVSMQVRKAWHLYLILQKNCHQKSEITANVKLVLGLLRSGMVRRQQLRKATNLRTLPRVMWQKQCCCI